MADKQNRGMGSKRSMLFSSWNYTLLLSGLGMVIAGFIVMYLENEVHGFISLYVSPVLIMGGYITVIVAIMKRDGGETGAPEQSNS